jgi:peptidoglycan/xylan/chitin deacetylase (PgdA/CDA1 family)
MMRRALVLTVALAALLALALGLWKVSAARNWQVLGRLVSHVATDQPLVALTFDDGPTGHTAEILDILARYDARATFFVMGVDAAANPGAARAIVAAGHELGNHSWSHDRMILMSPARIAEEIERTDEAIRAAGQEGAILFRPPFGKKLVGLPWYLWRHDRTTAMWDIEPDSDPGADAETIAAAVLDRVGPGSIILLHAMYDSRAETRAALPLILQGLQDRGLQSVPLSELLSAAP